jgi:hypothetical protein
LKGFELGASERFLLSMPVRHIESSGVLRKLDSRWFIEVTEDVEGLEANQQVKVLFWDARPAGHRSEYEEIANAQQLELGVVVQGLEAEGSLAREREAFLARLKRELV